MNRVPMRDGYGKALLELCRLHDDVMVLDADVAKSTRTEWIRQEFPDKYINVGISEQDLVGTAAGLSLTGFVPFVSTYGVFLTGRGWGQIRNTVCYNNLNVKLGGAHAGISVGPDGATHQALEDIALMRTIPNMTVITPCDWWETYKATLAVYDLKGPSYVRFGRNPAPVITREDTPFDLYKAAVFRDGRDVTLFANGLMVHEALTAAEALEGEGISARVVNVRIVKPLDLDTICTCAAETGAAVVCEEHQIMGGLGGAICEALAQHHPIPVELVGIQDRFGESGEPDDLLKAYNLSAEDVVAAVRKVMKRK